MGAEKVMGRHAAKQGHTPLSWEVSTASRSKLFWQVLPYTSLARGVIPVPFTGFWSLGGHDLDIAIRTLSPLPTAQKSWETAACMKPSSLCTSGTSIQGCPWPTGMEVEISTVPILICPAAPQDHTSHHRYR